MPVISDLSITAALVGALGMAFMAGVASGFVVRLIRKSRG